MGETTELNELDTEQVPVGAPEPSTVVTGGELPAQDDEHPAVVGDAEVDDGGVRTNSAVEPVADALATGAGAPKPPPANVDRDGREQFPDDVAPTARADYNGPNAPAGQGTDASAADESASEANPVPENVADADASTLADAHTGDELAAAAEARGVAKSGSKIEVAERLVEHDRDGQ